MRCSFSSCNAERMIRGEAEQTGKPTYHSYSSIPIEQASGPNAAQREAVYSEGDVRNRGVRRQKSQRTNRLGNRAWNQCSHDGCDLEEEIDKLKAAGNRTACRT